MSKSKYTANVYRLKVVCSTHNEMRLIAMKADICSVMPYRTRINNGGRFQSKIVFRALKLSQEEHIKCVLA